MGNDSNGKNIIDSVDDPRNKILAKIYVSNVSNRLREIDTPSEVDCKRWPWELMQNAKDSISGTENKTIDIILTIEENSVIFKHNGNPFNDETFYALLYKYSEGKKDNIESTGRFGTGFLTTHSLSKIVNIKGPIYRNNKIIGFDVTMYRDGKNDQELIEGVKRMEREKKLFPGKSPKWTIFKYSLKTQINYKSCQLGIDSFKNNVILTMLFNLKYNNIEFIDQNTHLVYKKGKEKKYIVLELVEYLIEDKRNKKIINKYFLHSQIKEKSKELTERYNKERFLNIECAIEIETKTKEIIINENSPCLFCSLPLIGSEKHILPFILNSNDFEPSTERQEILLDGPDFKKDEKRNDMLIITDVGINKYILKRSYELFIRIVSFLSDNKYNNLHLLTRGLNTTPKVDKNFDKNWYEENYINLMRNILYKFPIVYDKNNNLSLIKNIFFPIYDNYDNNFTKSYYELVKELFDYVPRYKESIEWSKCLWENDLKNNRITIDKCINKYHSYNNDEFNNKFIKFVFENYKQLLNKYKILINQQNNYVLYNEKEFAQSINVQEDLVNCLEELGYNWRENHLSNKINTIELPIKHDYDYAVHLIKKSIEKDKNKIYTLTRYIQANNEMRENIYYFTKLLFPDKVKDKIIVNNFNDEIWKKSDEYLFVSILNIVEKWNNLSNLPIKIEDYYKLLKIIYTYSVSIFDKRKILPSTKGDFNYLKDLFYENNVK